MSLKTLRRQAGLTQKELGRKLNVSHSAVSNWERGLCPPLRKYHRLMAIALNISEEELRRELYSQ